VVLELQGRGACKDRSTESAILNILAGPKRKPVSNKSAMAAGEEDYKGVAAEPVAKARTLVAIR
jgi:hypothetical protein